MKSCHFKPCDLLPILMTLHNAHHLCWAERVDLLKAQAQFLQGSGFPGPYRLEVNLLCEAIFCCLHSPVGELAPSRALLLRCILSAHVTCLCVSLCPRTWTVCDLVFCFFGARARTPGFVMSMPSHRLSCAYPLHLFLEFAPQLGWYSFSGH